jgi:hypothetical protein
VRVRVDHSPVHVYLEKVRPVGHYAAVLAGGAAIREGRSRPELHVVRRLVRVTRCQDSAPAVPAPGVHVTVADDVVDHWGIRLDVEPSVEGVTANVPDRRRRDDEVRVV